MPYPATPDQRPGAAVSQPPAQTADVPPPDDTVITEMPTQKIENGRAVFAGLDKITGRIIAFDAAINETVQFGALRVTARVCYTRPPTEATNTDAFVEVDEVTLQGEIKRIFDGWMFASSPGLHAVEHPIYDVWLTDCASPAVQVAEPAPPQAGFAPDGRPKKPRASQAGTTADAAAKPPRTTPAGTGTGPAAKPPRPKKPKDQSAQQSPPPPAQPVGPPAPAQPR